MMNRNGNSRNGEVSADDEVVRVLTTDQLLSLAEDEAQSILGVSREEAFKKLDRGELHGTIAEAEFSMLRDMIEA